VVKFSIIGVAVGSLLIILVGSQLGGAEPPFDKKILDFEWEVLHESTPRVLYTRHFLTDEECESVVNMSLPYFQRSQVAAYDKGQQGATKLNIVDNARTSSGTWISRLNMNFVIRKFTKRISHWSQLAPDHGEDIQVLEYKIGQEYKPHVDYFDPKYYEHFLQNGGQRIASVLCFLNDVPAGGETIFPYVNLKVKPKKGAAILWYNAFPNGTLDATSAHGGAPVMEGVKYVAIQWMRQYRRTSSSQVEKFKGKDQTKIIIGDNSLTFHFILNIH